MSETSHVSIGHSSELKGLAAVDVDVDVAAAADSEGEEDELGNAGQDAEAEKRLEAPLQPGDYQLQATIFEAR